ncbi:MAG: biotin transporter BioY [Spirochaetaceae bacterium]|jgi:biotin transport system substrate-specific component|nr:biotin transporter BioY [Spirochaetaceae bacterium]
MKYVVPLSKRRAIAGLALTALFAALIAAGTFIAIPLPFSPVPLVMQNLFSLLAGLILGPLLGGAAVGLYLAAGALGAPVFAGATGGFVHFFGPSGGFLPGYLLGAVAAGLIAGRPRTGRKTPLRRIIPAVVLGILAVYVPGLLRLKKVMDAAWPAVLTAGFFPFLPGDAVKGFAAVIIAPRLRRAAADQLDG